ncbi:MAG TPA: cytochrome P450 [Pseudomonadales bacterium]|nr:cytochrome P450 [Pseudomonadales bacterium]
MSTVDLPIPDDSTRARPGAGSTRTTPRVDLGALEARTTAATTEPDFLGCTAASWMALVAAHGPVMETEIDGRPTTLLCTHAADLEAWKTPRNWIYGPPASGGEFFRGEMGPLHVSQLDGDAHRRARKLTLPAFGAQPLLRDIDAVAACLEHGLADLAGTETDLHGALGTLYTRALGVSQVKADLSPEQARTLFEFEEAFIPAAALAPDVRARWYGRNRYVADKRASFELFERIVDARLAGARPGDSLDLVMDRAPPDGMAPLNREELVLATYLLLVAGVGNIANLVSPMLWALQTHPEWLTRLREELVDFRPDALGAGVRAFPVMRALISETERCFLPAAVLPKIAACDLELLGHRIPAGRRVLHLHGLAHFEAERYPDPFAFRPERWLEDEPQRPNAYGGGVHLCLGMGVARLYLPLTLALLVPRYDLHAPAPPLRVPQAPGLDCSPLTTSFPCTLTPRADHG